MTQSLLLTYKIIFILYTFCRYLSGRVTELHPITWYRRHWTFAGPSQKSNSNDNTKVLYGLDKYQAILNERRKQKAGVLNFDEEEDGGLVFDSCGLFDLQEEGELVALD